MPGYLCAVSNEKNALGVESTLSDNGKWSVEFAGSTVKMLAQGEFTRNLLQFNYNGFRCYNPSTTSVSSPLSIYCQLESGVDDATADMVKIIGEEGVIRVVAELADVTVYTMTGQTVAVAAVDGEATAHALKILSRGDLFIVSALFSRVYSLTLQTNFLIRQRYNEKMAY